MTRRHVNPSVVKCLFPDDGEEARLDNFVNLMQETLATELQAKMKKWNYDFVNDAPLPVTKGSSDSQYEWIRDPDSKYDFIGVQIDAGDEDNKDDEIGEESVDSTTVNILEDNELLVTRTDTTDIIEDDVPFLRSQLENEATPETSKERDAAPPVKRRKNEMTDDKKNFKRQLSFD